MNSYSEKVAFLQSCFGSVKVARDGINVAVKCPACEESKGKFSVNIDTWMCHCWVCGVKSKNLFFILKKYCEKSYAASFEKTFGPVATSTNSSAIAERTEDVLLPRDFIHLASHETRDPDVRDVIEYCRSRNISKRDMWYFGIGTGRSSKFRRRVIVPSFDKHGMLNYFVSRTIDSDRVPKYLNASSKKTEIIY